MDYKHVPIIITERFNRPTERNCCVPNITFSNTPSYQVGNQVSAEKYDIKCEDILTTDVGTYGRIDRSHNCCEKTSNQKSNKILERNLPDLVVNKEIELFSHCLPKIHFTNPCEKSEHIQVKGNSRNNSCYENRNKDCHNNVSAMLRNKTIITSLGESKSLKKNLENVVDSFFDQNNRNNKIISNSNKINRDSISREADNYRQQRIHTDEYKDTQNQVYQEHRSNRAGIFPNQRCETTYNREISNNCQSDKKNSGSDDESINFGHRKVSYYSRLRKSNKLSVLTSNTSTHANIQIENRACGENKQVGFTRNISLCESDKLAESLDECAERKRQDLKDNIDKNLCDSSINLRKLQCLQMSPSNGSCEKETRQVVTDTKNSIKSLDPRRHIDERLLESDLISFAENQRERNMKLRRRYQQALPKNFSAVPNNSFRQYHVSSASTNEILDRMRQYASPPGLSHQSAKVPNGNRVSDAYTIFDDPEPGSESIRNIGRKLSLCRQKISNPKARTIQKIRCSTTLPSYIETFPKSEYSPKGTRSCELRILPVRTTSLPPLTRPSMRQHPMVITSVGKTNNLGTPTKLSVTYF